MAQPTTVFDLLYRLVTGPTDACIVCSSTCSPMEIAFARAEDRMVVLDDGIGIILRPGTTVPAVPDAGGTPKLCGAVVAYDKDVTLQCTRAAGHVPPHNDLTKFQRMVWCDLKEGECDCEANHAYSQYDESDEAITAPGGL